MRIDFHPMHSLSKVYEMLMGSFLLVSLNNSAVVLICLPAASTNHSTSIFFFFFFWSYFVFVAVERVPFLCGMDVPYTILIVSEMFLKSCFLRNRL